MEKMTDGHSMTTKKMGHDAKTAPQMADEITSGEQAPTSASPRRRNVFTWRQLALLEQVFECDPLPIPVVRSQLAERVGVSSRCIQVWFQNRRQKWRVDHKADTKSVLTTNTVRLSSLEQLFPQMQHLGAGAITGAGSASDALKPGMLRHQAMPSGFEVHQQMAAGVPGTLQTASSYTMQPPPGVGFVPVHGPPPLYGLHPCPVPQHGFAPLNTHPGMLLPPPLLVPVPPHSFSMPAAPPPPRLAGWPPASPAHCAARMESELGAQHQGANSVSPCSSVQQASAPSFSTHPAEPTVFANGSGAEGLDASPSDAMTVPSGVGVGRKRAASQMAPDTVTSGVL